MGNLTNWTAGGRIIRAGDRAMAHAHESVAYTPIVARVPISVRTATMDDVAFVDRLQKAHSRELGFLPLKAIEAKVRLGQVSIACATRANIQGKEVSDSHSIAPRPLALIPVPIGYLIASDRYFKRDEIGYVTQINVAPEY